MIIGEGGGGGMKERVSEAGREDLDEDIDTGREEAGGGGGDVADTVIDTGREGDGGIGFGGCGGGGGGGAVVNVIEAG